MATLLTSLTCRRRDPHLDVTVIPSEQELGAYARKPREGRMQALLAAVTAVA
jgi:hypothetical protein